MKRSLPLSKLTSKIKLNKNYNPSKVSSFGPNLKESKPLQVKCGHIKKLIHYDCSKKKDDSEDDIPDENEVYVKENLLQSNTEENENNTPDDDFSIVNINMSRLLSLSNNSNSKNTSDNANISKENKKSKELNKKNNNGSFNKSKGGEISSGNGSIESITPNNITNNNNSNSNNTNSNSNSISNNISNNNNNYNNGHLSKNSITAKRKKFYDKLMKKDKKVLKINNKINNNEKTDQFDLMKNIPNNNSASSNIKITNNTNIILNVKSGTKSLDIRALNNNTNNDMMMRDLRKLHIITQKAICSISTINPLLDTLDNYTEANRERKYSNNKVLNNKRPIKELLINDNTDYGINQLLINNLTIDKKYNYINNPNININFNNNKPTSSQIINIININGGNYSMDQTKNILKNIPTSNLASIKESPYDTQYISKPPYIPRKVTKNKPYEFDTNTYNNIKQNKYRINKINKLPNKKYSHNNWHGNTINAVSTKNENGNNKGIKKYIEHLRKGSKGTNGNNTNNGIKKSIFIEFNKKIK